MKKYEEITLLEKIESKQVEKDLHFWQDFTMCFTFIGIIIFIFLIGYNEQEIALGLIVVMILGYFILWIIISPLKRLYKIARRNDLIRHDEMIRARERARLEDIDFETLIPKKNKEINTTIERLNLSEKMPKLPNIKK